MKPTDQFDMMRDARGKHARRRVCAACMSHVDELVAQGAATEVIVTLVHVSKAVVGERQIAHNARRPAIASPAEQPASRTCAACKSTHPLHRFAIAADTGARRRICDICLERVDDLLRGQASITDVTAETGVSRSTVSARRKELRLPPTVTPMPPARRAAILALAAAAEDAIEPDRIAAEVGEKTANVRRLLVREGLIVPAETRGPLTPEQLDQAQALLEDEAPYAEVARTTGIGMKTLARHFPGMGAGTDHKVLIAWINSNPARAALHDELTKGMARAR
ncbi:MAG: hypothetical protein J0J04_08270 [Microbacterium sp.]|uniref:hypothetical protein n=1 Tax=Microbacterium sp. TaxID=51671 RepID=UPI001AD4321C|nr:hypothetical protein [Microbacterium sp.]MBN9214796.1 hypothetical protein [Microbacterium sp.]